MLKCSVLFPFSNWDEPFVTVFKLGPQVPSTGEKLACIYCVDFSVCMILREHLKPSTVLGAVHRCLELKNRGMKQFFNIVPNKS